MVKPFAWRVWFELVCSKQLTWARTVFLVLAFICGFLALKSLIAPETALPRHINAADAANEHPSKDLEWDFGSVEPGRQLKHRFEVVNDSHTMWTLANVRRNCSCTVGELEPSEVRVGQTAQIMARSENNAT